MGFDITGLGSAFDFAKGIMDRFWPKQATEAEKLEAAAKMAPILEERENKIIEAQREIIVSEMQQGDAFTKRARPMIVYAGLLFIFLVHVVFPLASVITGKTPPALSLPEEFWWAWSGVCGIWVIGRSAEKRGSGDKITKLITGGK